MMGLIIKNIDLDEMMKIQRNSRRDLRVDTTLQLITDFIFTGNNSETFSMT